MGIERTPAGTSAAGAADSPDEHSGGPPGAGGPGGRAAGGGEGEPRAHRSPLTVALVAGAVLAAGGGAYWAAANGGTHTSNAADAAVTAGKAGPPPLALNGWSGTADTAGTDGPADGQTYRPVGALPMGPESAHVYQAQRQVPRADVARLAAALGVHGPVRLDGGFWRAGAAPGTTGPALQVTQDTPGSWVFSRYGMTPPCKPRTLAPSGAAVCYGTAGTTSSSSTGASSPASSGQAERTAAPVLTGAGLAGQPVDASQTSGPVRTITVDPVFEGLPTHGWRTSIQVASDGGLLSATGRLARLAQGPAYPVVSAERALQEMQRPGNRAPAACPTAHPGGGPGTASTQGPASAPDSAPAAGASAAPSINPGGPMLRPSTGAESPAASGTATDPGNPVDRLRPSTAPCVTGGAQPLEVRGATFGLSAQFVSGRPELVPSWLFRVARPGSGQPYTVAQPAVDPRFLAPPVGDPAGPPASAPSSTATRGASAVRPARIESYSVVGRTLTLRFYGGLCQTYSASVVGQSAGSVTVRVTGVVKNPRRICPMLAKQFTERVMLSKALDARTVHDASDGHAVVQQP